MADPKFVIPKLSGVNWQSWKVRLEMLLTRENLWYVVSEAVPDVLDRDEDWEGDDRKAKATIVLLLEDSQLPLVRGCEHARDVFVALRKYHQKTSRSVRVSLLKKLCAINLDESGNMEDHLLKVDDLFDRLEAAGMTLDKDTKVCMLLRSLPPSFDSLVAALDGRADDDVTLEVVKAKLSDEFSRRLERSAGANGHKVERAMKSEVKSDTRKCFYCQMPGHMMRNCRKFKASLKNDDSDGEERGKKKEYGKAKAAHSEVKHVAFSVGSSDSRSLWLIDSGASAHMSSDRAFFTELNEFAGDWITVADGQNTQILGEGRGVLYGLDDKNNVVRIDMSDVKFVPGLTTSLLSVGRLAKKNMSVSFGKEDCKIIDSNGDTVVTGTCDEGVYYLRVAEAAMKVVECGHQENCQHQWHRRLGHRDWAATERMLKKGMVDGIKVSDCGLKLVCDVCVKGKSADAPSLDAVKWKSDKVLDVIHVGVYGPMEHEAANGKHFVMHIVDEYTRFTVTYLLKHEIETAENLKEYVNWVEIIFGRKPAVVRLDAGGELDSQEMRKFYRAEGILVRYISPDSRSDSLVERKGEAIVEMAICMMIDAGLDKRYWGEAVLTATYLENRLLSKSIGKTPYESWWRQKPELSHMRVFGSEAYVSLPEEKRERKLVFVGYSIEPKGYRFLDRDTDEIVVSRDARFLELGDESSCVEVPLFEGGDHKYRRRVPKQEEKDATLQKDKLAEERNPLSDISEGVKVEDTEAAGQTVRRSTRSTQGVKPQRLEGYALGGIASCAFAEPRRSRSPVGLRYAKLKSLFADKLRLASGSVSGS